MPIPSSRSARSGGSDGEKRGYPRPSSPTTRPTSESSGERSYNRPYNNYSNDRDDSRSYDRERPVTRPPVVAPAPAVAPKPAPTPAEPKAAQFVLTDDLRELLKIVAESDLTEVLLENQGWKIHVKREKQPAIVEYVTPQVVAASAPVAVSHSGQVAAPTPASAPASEDTYHKVTAPMVGIFYRSPDPKARPFVQEGEMVEKGQVIGIIEAMKIMNEITSEHSGRCVRVNADNGQPVEYGQTLLLLEPA